MDCRVFIFEAQLSPQAPLPHTPLLLLSRPEALVRRGDLGDEIPDQGFLRF
jgi:hypothetical protein